MKVLTLKTIQRIHAVCGLHRTAISQHNAIHFINQTEEITEAYSLTPRSKNTYVESRSRQGCTGHTPQHDDYSLRQDIQNSPSDLFSVSAVSIHPVDSVKAVDNPSYSSFRLEGLDPVCWTANDLFNSSNSEQDILVQSRTSIATLPTPTTDFSTTEAHLLKTFIHDWGPLLDCNDSNRHFSRIIPRLALARSKSLLYAIFTIAALYLSRIEDYPSSTVQYYRKQCAQALLPALQEDSGSVHEEDIFATYVLLRVYDHLTGMHSTGLWTMADPSNILNSQF